MHHWHRLLHNLPQAHVQIVLEAQRSQNSELAAQMQDLLDHDQTACEVDTGAATVYDAVAKEVILSLFRFVSGSDVTTSVRQAVGVLAIGRSKHHATDHAIHVV